MPNVNSLTLAKMIQFAPNTASRRGLLGFESACVASLDYELLDPEEGTTGSLTVVFQERGTYKYNDVPLDVYVDFSMAESQGRYFNLYIRDKFPTQRIS